MRSDHIIVHIDRAVNSRLNHTIYTEIMSKLGDSKKSRGRKLSQDSFDSVEDAWAKIRDHFENETLPSDAICVPFLGCPQFFQPWSCFAKVPKSPNLTMSFHQRCNSNPAQVTDTFVPLGPIGKLGVHMADHMEGKLETAWMEMIRTEVETKMGDENAELVIKSDDMYRLSGPTLSPGDICIDMERAAKLRNIKNKTKDFKMPKSLYVIHETIFCKSFSLSLQKGRETQIINEQKNALVGIVLTKYKTTKDRQRGDGWLGFPVEQVNPLNFQGLFVHPTEINWNC